MQAQPRATTVYYQLSDGWFKKLAIKRRESGIPMTTSQEIAKASKRSFHVSP
jgi:hypothetical protein